MTDGDIRALIREIPEAKEAGLSQLSEFIEDCEYTALATRVLHLLGKEGPALPAPQPSQFIRFIYNRVILENAPVRASAVSALQIEILSASIASRITACTCCRMRSVPPMRWHCAWPVTCPCWCPPSNTSRCWARRPIAWSCPCWRTAPLISHGCELTTATPFRRLAA